MPATEEERQAWLEQSEREKNELMDSFQAQAQSQFDALQAELDAEFAQKLKVREDAFAKQLADAEEAVRIEFEQAAQKALDDEQARLKADFEREREAFRIEVEQLAQQQLDRALEDEESRLRSEFDAERQTLLAQVAKASAAAASASQGTAAAKQAMEVAAKAAQAEADAKIASAVRAETEKLKAQMEKEQEAFRREVEEFANKALAEEQARLLAESQQQQEEFRQQVQMYAQKALEEEEIKLKQELQAETDKIRLELEALAQKELDAEAARLQIELAREQEAFRLQVQDFAQKALEEEELRMREETDREKEAFRIQVQEFASKALEDEENALKAELLADKEKFREQMQEMAQRAIEEEEQTIRAQAEASAQKLIDDALMSAALSHTQMSTQLEQLQREHSALTQQHQAITDRIHISDAELVAHRERLASAQADLALSRAELAKERANHERTGIDHQDKINQLNSKIAGLEHQLSVSQRELSAAVAQCDALKAQLQQLQQEFDNATATIGRLEASLALAQSSGDDTQVKLNSILSQSELKVKQSEQSVRDKEAHITTLNQQLQQFKQNEVVHNEQMSAMRRQLDNQADANPGTQSDSVLSDELYRLKQEKQRLQQKFDDAEQQISDLNDEVDNLRIQQSRRAPVEFSAKNAVMPDEQTDNKSDNATVSDLQAQIASLKAALSTSDQTDLQSELSAERDRYNTLKQRNAQLKSEVDKARASADDLQHQLDLQKADSDRAQQTLSRMESRLQAEQRAGDSLRAQLTQAHTDADQQRLDAVGKDAALRSAQTALVLAQQQHLDAKAESERLQHKTQRLEESVGTLTGKLSAVDVKLAQLQSEKAAAVERSNQLAADLATARAEATEALAQMTALSQQLNDLKSSTSMSSLTNLQQSSRLVSLETELANAHAMQAAAASELAAAQQQLGLARTQAMAQATAKIQTIESRAAEVEEALRAQSQQHEKALRQLRDQMYDERTVWETERQQLLQRTRADLDAVVAEKRAAEEKAAVAVAQAIADRDATAIDLQASKAAAASAQQRLRDVMTGNNDGAQALNDRCMELESQLASEKRETASQLAHLRSMLETAKRRASESETDAFQGYDRAVMRAEEAEKKLTVAQRELEKARISADDAALRIQALQRQISVLEDNKYMDSDMPGAAPTSGSTPDFDSGAHVAAAVAAAVAEATKEAEKKHAQALLSSTQSLTVSVKVLESKLAAAQARASDLEWQLASQSEELKLQMGSSSKALDDANEAIRSLGAKLVVAQSEVQHAQQQAKAQRESHLAGIAAARLDAKRALVDTETLKIKNKADSVLDTMHGRVEVAREALAVAQSMFNDVNSARVKLFESSAAKISAIELRLAESKVRGKQYGVDVDVGSEALMQKLQQLKQDMASEQAMSSTHITTAELRVGVAQVRLDQAMKDLDLQKHKHELAVSRASAEARDAVEEYETAQQNYLSSHSSAHSLDTAAAAASAMVASLNKAFDQIHTQLDMKSFAANSMDEFTPTGLSSSSSAAGGRAANKLAAQVVKLSATSTAIARTMFMNGSKNAKSKPSLADRLSAEVRQISVVPSAAKRQISIVSPSQSQPAKRQVSIVRQQAAVQQSAPSRTASINFLNNMPRPDAPAAARAPSITLSRNASSAPSSVPASLSSKRTLSISKSFTPYDQFQSAPPEVRPVKLFMSAPAPVSAAAVSAAPLGVQSSSLLSPGRQRSITLQRSAPPPAGAPGAGRLTRSRDLFLSKIDE